jgi:pimeloyl-ACP methyl ester carboxylesterase
VPTYRRAGLAAALAAAPFALAYRFALVYRVRAGYPRQHPPVTTPDAFGLPFIDVPVITDLGRELPGWFIPARDGAPGPGVALIHGWESARDRTLPNALFLHAAGFHVLTVDVRGHGANPPEELPLSAGEFGADAGAAFRALIDRPEVSAGAILGHSMGSVGAVLAAASNPEVRALVATATPADPYRLTRETFRLAHLPLPDPIAYPLAWLTTRVYLRPRRHRVAEVSASRAIARYRGPILLIHGSLDDVVPASHLRRLEAAARGSRSAAAGATIRSLVLGEGRHSWLYEFPAYRRAVASFLAEALGGPLTPEEAGAVAEAVPAVRIPDAETRLTAVAAEPGGFRTLVGIARPGALEPPPTLDP